MTRQEIISRLALVQNKLDWLAGEISINTPIIEALAILMPVLETLKAGPIVEEK